MQLVAALARVRIGHAGVASPVRRVAERGRAAAFDVGKSGPRLVASLQRSVGRAAALVSAGAARGSGAGLVGCVAQGRRRAGGLHVPPGLSAVAGQELPTTTSELPRRA